MHYNILIFYLKVFAYTYGKSLTCQDKPATPHVPELSVSFICKLKKIHDCKCFLVTIQVVLRFALNYVVFTRLVRTEGQGEEPAMMYVWMNTMNIRWVHRIVEEAGFTVHIPTLDLD